MLYEQAGILDGFFEGGVVIRRENDTVSLTWKDVILAAGLGGLNILGRNFVSLLIGLCILDHQVPILIIILGVVLWIIHGRI